jgi:hypothetical protein
VSIDGLMAEGLRLLRRQWFLAAFPMLKYVAICFVSAVCALPSVAAAILLASNPGALLAVLFLSAVTWLSAVAAVSSYFGAAQIGVSSDALAGKPPTFESFAGWGSRRWSRIFMLYAAVYAFYAGLCVLFLPAGLLFLAGQNALAVSAALACAAVASAAFALSVIVLLPASYILVLEDLDFAESILASASYMRENLAAAAVLTTSTTVLTILLSSAASVLSGPPQLIPYAGIFISIPLMALSFLLTTCVTDAVTVLWWVSLLREKPSENRHFNWFAK